MLSTEKLKQTQQKQTSIRNKICYNIKLTKKLKPGLIASYDIQAWKQRGPILVLVLHKFVTYLRRHLLTSPGSMRSCSKQQQYT